jgi:hypothetical protein
MVRMLASAFDAAGFVLIEKVVRWAVDPSRLPLALTVRPDVDIVGIGTRVFITCRIAT